MKVILEKLTASMEVYQTSATEESVNDNMTDELSDLLLELRDIVEQIDYARAFCSLQGYPFCWGASRCSSRNSHGVPRDSRNAVSKKSTRSIAIARSGVHLHSERFVFCFRECKHSSQDCASMSANVRNHDMAEHIFCQVPQATQLMEEGMMGMDGGRNDAGGEASEALKKRTLFFLRALITGGAADRTEPGCTNLQQFSRMWPTPFYRRATVPI